MECNSTRRDPRQRADIAQRQALLVTLWQPCGGYGTNIANRRVKSSVNQPVGSLNKSVTVAVVPRSPENSGGRTSVVAQRIWFLWRRPDGVAGWGPVRTMSPGLDWWAGRTCDAEPRFRLPAHYSGARHFMICNHPVALPQHLAFLAPHDCGRRYQNFTIVRSSVLTINPIEQLVVGGFSGT